MHAHVRPPDALGVGVTRLVRGDTFFSLQPPTTSPVVQRDGRHQLPLSLLGQLPTPHVVTAGDDSGADAFGDPRADDEIADLGFHPDEVAGPHAEARGVTGMNPE